MVSTVPGLRCRQIAEADLDAVIALLARGFPNRGQRFWRRAFAQLSQREPPRGLPKYGYLLENDESPVGVLLLICATMQTADTTNTRCNLSSWYVEPEFRAYAPLLVAQALRHKDVTYLNVSPAPNACGACASPTPGGAAPRCRCAGHCGWPRRAWRGPEAGSHCSTRCHTPGDAKECHADRARLSLRVARQCGRDARPADRTADHPPPDDSALISREGPRNRSDDRTQARVNTRSACASWPPSSIRRCNSGIASSIGRLVPGGWS